MQKVQVCSIPTQFFPHTKHYQAPAIQFFKCLPFTHVFCNEHPSKCYIPDNRLSQIPEESGTSELLGKQGMMAAALLLICFTANFLKNFSVWCGFHFWHSIYSEFTTGGKGRNNTTRLLPAIKTCSTLAICNIRGLWFVLERRSLFSRNIFSKCWGEKESSSVYK